MAVKLRVPASLRKHAHDQPVIDLEGESVGGILDSISASYPELAAAMLGAPGELKPHLQLFVNGRNVRENEAADLPLSARDDIILISPVAGG